MLKWIGLLLVLIVLVFSMVLIFSRTLNKNTDSVETEVIAMIDDRIELKETAIFAGGCFWCIEAAFLNLKGVISVDSGYTGGETVNPTYEQVSNGDTGHYEAVKIEY